MYCHSCYKSLVTTEGTENDKKIFGFKKKKKAKNQKILLSGNSSGPNLSYKDNLSDHCTLPLNISSSQSQEHPSPGIRTKLPEQGPKRYRQSQGLSHSQNHICDIQGLGLGPSTKPTTVGQHLGGARDVRWHPRGWGRRGLVPHPARHGATGSRASTHH